MDRHVQLILAAVLAACLPTTGAHTAEPAPAQVLAGTADEYRPRRLQLGPMVLQIYGRLAGRYETVDAIATAQQGVELDGGSGAVDLLARAGLMLTSFDSLAPMLVMAEFEMDAFTGVITDAPALDGDGIPNTGGNATALIRKANATLSYRGIVSLRGGVTTSTWGLGLIANDGDGFWAPGSADLTDPRGGDRVIRGQLILRSRSKDNDLLGAVAFDKVLDDDVLRDGDSAYQGVAAVRWKTGPLTVGAYGVYRRQEARDGDTIKVFVADLYAEMAFALAKNVELTLATEGAIIAGTTTLAPNADFPEHDVLQLGGVLRASLDAGQIGGVLDVFYASGDHNLDDDAQNAFKADPNFSMGMLLFPYVLAAQTGHATVTAADLDLLGYAPPDLDRYPTRGSATSTAAIFPRFWIRPGPGLEIYGGPLFAFAVDAPPDPLATRLSGGSPRNALGKSPGSYYGTELDLGIRYRMLLWGTELVAGLEGAAFFPGDAISGDNVGDGVLLGGRAMLSYRF